MLEDDDDIEDYSDALPIGMDLGDYVIAGYLGRGSFGITYRARENKLKRDVAIKEYMPREWARRFPDNSIGTIARKTSGTFHYGLERFTMEAQNLAACRQENIVKVHRLLEQNATSYMVMELLDGETLENRILRAGRLSWDELAPIFRGLLDGCRDIHRRGILHRDIKPANIVLRDLGADGPDGTGGCQPVLIDFGAAREIRRQAGGRLSTILTEEYAPLEQWTGTEEQGPYTDIYALAATMSHALTGTIPVMAPARKHNAAETLVEKAAGLAPDDVLRGLDHGLSLAASDRPQTVDAWIAGMPSLAGTPPPAAAGEAPVAERAPLNRRTVLALAGGAALAGVSAWLFLSRTDISGSARPLRVDWARAYDAVGPNGVKPAVAIAPDGGAFAVASVATGEAIHMVAMKLDARGVERARWISPEDNAQAFAVRSAPGGGLFVGGGADMLAGDGGAVTSGKGLLVRLDARFAPLWRTEFEGAILTSLIPQGRNELLAAFDGVNNSGVAMLQRVVENGEKRGGPIELNDRRGDSAREVIALPDGQLAVLGARENGPSNVSIWISCVNPEGRELWRASDAGELAARGLAGSEGWDVVAAADSLFVVGRGLKAAPDAGGEPTFRSMAMRLDLRKSGAIQWVRADYEPDPRSAAANASARCLASVGAGEPSIYAAGWHNNPFQGWLRQLDGEGNVVWAMEQMGQRGFVPTCLQLDETGGYVVGVFNPDAQTAKLMVARLVFA
jgi:serine/threonine protein kinase